MELPVAAARPRRAPAAITHTPRSSRSRSGRPAAAGGVLGRLHGAVEKEQVDQPAQVGSDQEEGQDEQEGQVELERQVVAQGSA